MQPIDPRAARVPHGLERVHVTELVAEDDDRAGPLTGEQALHGLALATGGAWPQVHDRSPAVVFEAVVIDPIARLDGGDRGHDGRPRGRDVVGLADVERDGRTFAFHEQPPGVAELVRHPGRQALCRVGVHLEPRLGRDPDALRVAAAREPAMLQPMVAQVLDPADPDAGRDVGHDPAGQDDDRDASGPLDGEPRQPAQGPLRDGVDRGGARVSRAGRERSVEVDHDEQRWRGGHEPGDRGFQLGRTRDGWRRRSRARRPRSVTPHAAAVTG